MWNAWKWIDEASATAADPAAQPQRRLSFVPRLRAPEDLLPHRPFHHRMMPGKRSKRNLDPSRPVALDAGGTCTPAGDHDDRAVLQGSVGGACWRSAAADGALGCGSRCCSSGVLDRSACRCRKPFGSLAQGKTFAAEPLRREPPPCVIAGGNWTTAVVSWQVGTSSVWFTCRWLPNTEPCRSNGRVPSISRLETRYFVQPSLWMIGPMIAPSAR